MIRYINVFIPVLIFTLLSVNVSSGKDITVCSECGYKNIKSALADSEDGDVIIVKKGYYRENNIIIDKSVQISGEDNPVIDLEFNNQGFVIKKDNVIIRGLEIRNISVSYVKDLSALKVENSSGCKIENNFFYNTFFAVYLGNSDNCLIKGNKIQGFAQTESSSGNGIHLWKCSNIRIENNETSGHRDGIYFEFVTKSHIINNHSHNNLRYGLHFMFSDSNSYRKNVFSENGAGVAVMYTKNIIMEENTFVENWGPASYGILLKDISRSIIRRNKFIKNTIGIFMEGSDKMNIEENEFRDNGYAVKVFGNCSSDTLIRNNFLGNTFDISTNSSRNENIYSGNYWDKYRGYDMNKDNTGDVPYRPVSLYSMLVEKVPESIIMMRSFITEIIDLTEKAIPVFIPESLVDEKPKMILNEYN